MQRIYAVQNVDQLMLYADELADGIAAILIGAREHGQDKRTPEQIWDELVEHVETAPHAKLWLAIEDGVLMAWLAGKVYIDGKKRNGCITWAWAAPRCQVSRKMIEAAEAFFRERGCQAAYLGRAFLQTSFTRLMRRYGYQMATVVYEKRLDEVQHVTAIGPVGREVGTDDAEGQRGDPAGTGAISADAADVRPSAAGDRGADGAPAGNSDSGADPAGDIGAAAADAADAEHGEPDRPDDGTAADVCGRSGSGGSGSTIVAPRSEPAGPADAGAAGATGAEELLHVHADRRASG